MVVRRLAIRLRHDRARSGGGEGGKAETGGAAAGEPEAGGALAEGAAASGASAGGFPLRHWSASWPVTAST